MAATIRSVEAMKTTPATITTHAATAYSRGGFSRCGGGGGGGGGAVATGAVGVAEGSGVSLMSLNIAQGRNDRKRLGPQTFYESVTGRHS
jgi:hypothetical protein